MGIDRFLFGDPTLAFLQRSLNVQDARTAVIAGNLANVDTPGYKARNLDFEKALETAQNDAARHASLKRTNSRHLPGSEETDFPVDVIETDQESIRVDGNTVDQDEEIAKRGSAHSYYNASLTAYSKKLKILNTVLNARI